MLLTDAERLKKWVDGREENEKISVNCEKSWWKRKYFNKVRIYIYIFILRWLVGITISDYETSKDINGLGPNPSYDPNIFDKKKLRCNPACSPWNIPTPKGGTTSYPLLNHHIVMAGISRIVKRKIHPSSIQCGVHLPASFVLLYG